MPAGVLRRWSTHQRTTSYLSSYIEVEKIDPAVHVPVEYRQMMIKAQICCASSR